MVFLRKKDFLLNAIFLRKLREKCPADQSGNESPRKGTVVTMRGEDAHDRTEMEEMRRRSE